MAKDIKALSIGNPTTSAETPSVEMYQLSCLLRMADATEAMAQNHVQLIRDRDNYERWYRDGQRLIKELQAKNASLRGVITRMKNRENRAAQQEPAGE